jgi:nitrite transporter NirC
MKNIKALLAGVIIAFGGYAYLSIENKYLGAFLFSFGLLTIISKGYELFTGKIYALKVSSLRDWIRKLSMLFWNFIGVCVVGISFRFSTGLRTNLLWETKFNNGWFAVIILSFFCGMLMYLAVTLYAKENNPLYVVMPIMLFILTGCEHCVANMFYLILVSEISWEHLIYLFINIIGNAMGSLVFFNLERKKK